MQAAKQVLAEQDERGHNGQDVAAVNAAQQRLEMAGSVHGVLQRLLEVQTV